MFQQWAIKDLISGEFVSSNSYWDCSLIADVDKAHLWKKEAHAKAFITSNKDAVRSNSCNSVRSITSVDLMPVPIEVSRSEG